jgi:hypothetical protein
VEIEGVDPKQVEVFGGLREMAVTFGLEVKRSKVIK